MTTTDSLLINLNSRDATQYKNGDSLSSVVFGFRNILKLTDDVVTVQLSLQNFQCVCSFYAVNETCNVLHYLFSGTQYYITLAPGNYNANTLIAELTTQFLAKGHSFTITLNRTNGRFSFLSPGATFTFYSDSSSKQILGLGNTNLVSAASTITCPVSANLLGITALRVSSQLLPTKGYDSGGGGACTSILASIPVDNSSSSFGLLSYTNLSNFAPILSVQNIDLIDIQITDQANSFVNFNAIHWTCSLCLTVTRRIIDTSGITLGPTPTDTGEPAPQVDNGSIEEQFQ